MSQDHDQQPRHDSSLGWKLTLLICCLLLLGAAGLVALIFSTEPTAVRTGATKETAMLVEVSTGQQGTFHPTIDAMGTVVPARDIVLRPRVEGTIVERSPAFTPGGFVTKGQTLLRIDPADYAHALRQRQSELNQVLADLSLEMGRQRVARKDYQAVQEKISEEEKELVLRQPQLNTVQARIDSARAAVDQAKLQLKRTYIQAPFDAHVLSREVNLGSQVAAGDALGRLVGLDTYWVEITVPLAHLSRLSFADSSGSKGSKVHIRNRSAWPRGQKRQGHLLRYIGALEDQTRMARVLAAVPDPLARQDKSGTQPVLMIGSFVQARIQAKAIQNVFLLDRDYVRQDDTVWIMEGDHLDIRQVRIAFRDAEYAYIRDGLRADERVVTTNLATVVQGAKLRLRSSESGSGQGTQSDNIPKDSGPAGASGQ